MKAASAASVAQVVTTGEVEVERAAMTEGVHQHVRRPPSPLLLEDVDVRLRVPNVTTRPR